MDVTHIHSIASAEVTFSTLNHHISPQVAESANFPAAVVEMAKTKLAELESAEAGLKVTGMPID